jgi:hypothetical protein
MNKSETNETLPESISDLFTLLNRKIDGIDGQVGQIVQVHESEFLNAYRIHMIDIQKEIKQLKLKITEEELKRKKDEEILIREKERDWFREEALRLNKVCKEYMKSTEVWKSRTKMLEEDKKALEEKIKYLNKKIESKSNDSQKVSISKITPDVSKSFITESAATLNFRTGDFYESTLGHLKKEVENYKKILRKSKGETNKILGRKHDLENLFEECVRVAIEDSKNTDFLEKSCKRLDELEETEKRRILYLLVAKPEVAELIKSFVFRTRKSLTPTKFLQRNSTTSHGLRSHIFSTPKRNPRVRHLPYFNP